MPDLTGLVQLAIAATALLAVTGWLSLVRAQTRERNTETRRIIGKQRRDRSVREIKHRSRRWYRWQGRLQLVGLFGLAQHCGLRAGRLWRDAKDLEREPADAYALRALPFTTRR
jgi:hypothetical protein